MEDKLQVITDLENQINADAGLDAEVKTKVKALIDEVKKEPTDANIEALAVVLDSLANAEAYREAVALLSGLMAVTAETDLEIEKAPPVVPTL